MSRPTASGIIRPDERSVACVSWGRGKDGIPTVDTDDHTRPYVFVAEEEAQRFEEAAERQEWKVRMVGYDDFLDRRTYAIEYIPPALFRALDLTKPKDVMALNRAIRDRPKRFNTSGLREKAVAAAHTALEKSIGMMKATPGEGENATEKAERTIEKGVELSARLITAVVSMEGTNQADEHLNSKNARMDAGLATENMGIVKTYVVEQEIADQV